MSSEEISAFETYLAIASTTLALSGAIFHVSHLFSSSCPSSQASFRTIALEDAMPQTLQTKFEQLDSIARSNKRNAASATSTNSSPPVPLNRFVYSSNADKYTSLACILYSIQCGLYWFVFVSSLKHSLLPTDPLLQNIFSQQLFWCAMSWSILQLNSSYKVVKLYGASSDTISIRNYKFYSLLWEITFLLISLFFEIYRFYDQYLTREINIPQLLVLINILFILFIVGSINSKPIQKREIDLPTNSLFEGNVYTSNDQLLQSPEESSSFYGLMLFSWLNDLMRLANKVRLGYVHLYKMQDCDLPAYSWGRFAKVSSEHPNSSFFIKLLRVFRPELLAQLALVLCLSFLKFSGPYFLNKILNFLENTDLNNDPTVAYKYCIGLIFFGFIQIIFDSQALWLGRKISIRLRNIISCELVKKSLSLAPLASVDNRKHTKGLGKSGHDQLRETSSSGMLMNLMTVDLNKLVEMSAYLNYSLLAVMQLIFGIVFLYQLMGVSSIAGLVVMVLYTRFSEYLFNIVMKLQSQIYAISDKRLAAIGELVSGIKAVKLFGWESQFILKVTTVRNEQLKALWGVKKLATVNWFFLGLAPILVLASVFWLYTVVLGNKITAEVAFTSLSVFNIIRNAFENIPWIFDQLISGKVSIDRIDSYLQQPEIQLLSDRCAQSDAKSFIGFENATLVWSNQSKSEGSSDETPNLSVNSLEQASNSTALQQPLLNSSTCDYNSITSPPPQPSVFTLPRLNIRFPVGQISLLSGPVGSGKSSILRALVGEMKLTSGSIVIPTNKDVSRLLDIAYVPQEPWLRNASVRDNILFGQEYNQEKYEGVLFATALKADLRTLENGDMTLVGERGVSLSGGQKQRVSLARALYSTASTILIDDTLSAVDSHTANHIVQNCFINKKFTEGKTIILATHHIQISLPSASWVVLIRDGSVVTQGTPQNVVNHPEYSSIVTSISKKKHKKSKDNTKDNHTLDNDYKSEDHHNSLGLQANAGGSTSVGELEEERGSGRVKFNIWRIYYNALGGGRFWFIAMFLAISGQIVSVFHTYWVRIWVLAVRATNLFLVTTLLGVPSAISATYYTASNWFIGSSPKILEGTAPSSAPYEENVSIYYLNVYLLIGLIMCLVRVLVYYYFYLGSLRASKGIHERLLASVTHARQSFFDKTPIGQVINRFSRDIQRVDEGLVESLMMWISEALNTLTVMVIVAYVVPPFLIVGFVMFSYFVYIASQYLNGTREMKRMEANTLSPLLSLFSELIPGISSIRAFGKQSDYVEETVKRVDNHNRPYYYLWAANRWLCVNTDTAGLLVSFITAIVVVYNRDRIDAGLAGFTLTYSFTFSISMMWVVRYAGEVELGLNSIERISQYYETGLSQEAPNIILSNRPPANWPYSGQLKVSNLSVRYSGGNLVLKDLNFEVSGGERVAIVGRTGAGKSTLVHTLMRLTEPEDGGKVVLDGVNILEIGLEDLRRNITIIPQDPMLFSGTIRYNLDLFGEYTDEEIWEALHQAHLVSSPKLTVAITGDEEENQSASNRHGGDVKASSLANSTPAGQNPPNVLPNDQQIVAFENTSLGSHIFSPGESASVSAITSANVSTDDAGDRNINGNLAAEKSKRLARKPEKRRQRYPFSSLTDIVSEGGANLSLGQRQLVALSRALLRKSKLTIFDEATASVDFATDLKIQTTIRGSGFGQSTILVIAHRLKSIMDFDKVILLQNGTVIGLGSPFELINTNPVFKNMCELTNEYDTLYAIAEKKSQII